MEDKCSFEPIPVIAVVGPTASGKTRLAVDLAERFGGEVISADSMQVYRYMDIGTAKATAEERRGIPHHMLDFLDPGQPFSVADYVELAGRCAADIVRRGKVPVVAGGTGLYVDSLLRGTVFQPIQTDPSLRLSLQREAEEKGGEALLEQLAQVDPELAAKLHPNNTGRIIRALEVFRLTGVPMSVQQREAVSHPSPYRPCWIGLDFSDRQVLYQRINRRVEQMLRDGLEEEARSLTQRGFGGTAAQAIGYKEFFPCWEGKRTLAEAEEEIKLQSRQYAKRQLTWFRRNKEIQWLYPDVQSYPELLETAAGFVRDQLKLTPL